MTRARRRLAGLLLAVAAVLGALGLLARAWLPGDAELAARLAARFEQATGIGLTVGGARLSLWPVPQLVLSELATVQPQPITVQRLALRPRLWGLWRREVALAELEIEEAVLPRAAMRAFRGRASPDEAVPARWRLAPIPVEQVRVHGLTWVDRRGIALAYDGEAVFDPGWRPREAWVQRPGVAPPARLHLVREGGEDRWRTGIDVGGGTWNGESRLHARADGELHLTAELAPRGVDVEALVQAFGRRTPVAGTVEGRTTLEARGPNPAALVRSLHTRTQFTVRPATLTRLDLARAVVTAGTSRGGTTALDELTGTLDTQATGDGVRLRYSDLKARSGILRASGNARVFNRKLDGEAAVDIVDGVVGVPLKIGGTVESPELSLTGGALAGAAAGTAVLPGVGTAIGARIGQQVERLFGGQPPAEPAPKPPQAPKPRR